MVRTLLDTCVLSEIRKPNCHPGVKAAVAAIPDADLYLSVVTLGEVVKGVSLLAAGKKKKEFGAWLAELEAEYADRTLPIDCETARIWGEMEARTRTAGTPIPTVDGLIAATALRHGLHVMTRNTRDFAPTGAMVVNPWEGNGTTEEDLPCRA